MNQATLTLRFPDAEAAVTAMRSLAPDNMGHCTLSLEGATLRVAASGAKVGTLLATMDDVLCCLRALHPDL